MNRLISKKMLNGGNKGWKSSRDYCCLFSFGWFPGVWFIYADVSEHSICSIFKGRCEVILGCEGRLIYTGGILGPRKLGPIGNRRGRFRVHEQDVEGVLCRLHNSVSPPGSHLYTYPLHILFLHSEPPPPISYWSQFSRAQYASSIN